MSDTKTKELILARRARFIAAAVACAGIASAATSSSGCCPQTCLEPAIDTDGGPVVCLSVMPEQDSLPLAPPNGTGDAPDAAADAIGPRVCLSPARRSPRDG